MTEKMPVNGRDERAAADAEARKKLDAQWARHRWKRPPPDGRPCIHVAGGLSLSILFPQAVPVSSSVSPDSPLPITRAPLQALASTQQGPRRLTR